jgi:spore coat polysaccharide biosynthesis protein SpsF
MKHMPRVVGIVQARMGSTRLPGKVLEDIAGKPMLLWVVERVRRAETVDSVVIATTTEAGDDQVVKCCEENGIPFFRGENEDVLQRYLSAAREFRADVVLRITADCPLMDPKVIDKTVDAFLEHYPEVDFVSNRGSDRIRRTYPIGMDVEVMTVGALERAGREATKDFQREHVTPFLYQQAGSLRTLSVDSDGDYGSLRWTVDTAEDLAFVRQIYSRFPGQEDFGMQEILDLLAREPDLAKINAGVEQKSIQDAK